MTNKGASPFFNQVYIFIFLPFAWWGFKGLLRWRATAPLLFKTQLNIIHDDIEVIRQVL
jgi:hypothetical protein